MNLRISQIAELIQAKIEGNADLYIQSLAKIETAKQGELSFLGNLRYESFLYSSNASAIIVDENFTPSQEINPTLLRVANPYEAFRLLLSHVSEADAASHQGIEELAFVHADATIGKEVSIGAFSYISEGVVIGDNVRIFPGTFVGKGVEIGSHTTIASNVSIYHACKIGQHCLIHAGTVIGSDGFGFLPQPDGSFQKVPQTGNVVIEDGVEIGANCCIDRATLGSTTIRSGAKLDNLIQLAHNVEIGSHSVIAAQAGIAGSSKLGAYCMIGGQVGIVGHLEIADQTRIDAQSGVNRSIKQSGQAFRGSPIQAFRQQLKSEVLFRKLTELSQQIHNLQTEISLLKNKKE
ncbi:MAG: UDP-3-O-(3-hydroxymyristoyl)glucosamine N-acyltransferase [Bacteroidota bacterium]